LANATGRAITSMNTPRRAVTLPDYETLALETPGTQIARVTARANFDPDFPNKTTPGTNTIIIMPNMPAPRPAPSPGLRQAVAAHLYRRRVIGTRVKVAGPTYKGLIVRATVRARAGMNRSEVRQSVIAALHDFFHPLTGGPERIGWPFGRDVFRSEVLQTIDEVPGVNYVLLLELISDSGQPTNGNVSLGPLELVDSGQHQIEVV
jgi:predicted phage baseplate assembly protein